MTSGMDLTRQHVDNRPRPECRDERRRIVRIPLFGSQSCRIHGNIQLLSCGSSDRGKRSARHGSDHEQVDIVRESTTLTGAARGPGSIDQYLVRTIDAAKKFTEHGNGSVRRRDQIAHGAEKRMLAVRPNEPIAPLLAIAQDCALDEPPYLSMDDRPAHPSTPADLGQRQFTVGVPEQLSQDRPDRIRTHERRQLWRGSLHKTGIYLPFIGSVKLAVTR